MTPDTAATGPAQSLVRAVADEIDLDSDDRLALIEAVATGRVVEMLDAEGDHIGYRIAR